jgi:hypothetical protein
MFSIHVLDMYNDEEQSADYVSVVTGYGRIWHQGDHPSLNRACKEANRLMNKRGFTASKAWRAAFALLLTPSYVPGSMTTAKLADELAEKRTYARLFASIIEVDFSDAPDDERIPSRRRN